MGRSGPHTAVPLCPYAHGHQAFPAQGPLDPQEGLLRPCACGPMARPGPGASWLLHVRPSPPPSQHSTPSWPHPTFLLLQSNTQSSCKCFRINQCLLGPLRFPHIAEVTQDEPACELRAGPARASPVPGRRLTSGHVIRTRISQGSSSSPFHR